MIKLKFGFLVFTVGISFFAPFADAYILGRGIDGRNFLLHAQDDQVRYQFCGERPITMVESSPLSEILQECDKGFKRTRIQAIPKAPTYTVSLNEYQRSVASFYGIGSSYFRNKSYYQALSSLAGGQEKRYRKYLDVPTNDEDHIHSESVRILLRAHEELLQYVDSEDRGLDLSTSSTGNAKLNYIVVAALVPTFSDGSMAYRVLPQFKSSELDDVCTKAFDSTWAPVSVDLMMGVAIAPVEYEELELILRTQLKTPPAAPSPRLVAWQAWYGLGAVRRAGDVPQYKQTHDYFTFSFETAAKDWVFQYGPKINAMMEGMSTPQNLLQYPGYGTLFRKEPALPAQPTLCARGVESLQNPIVPDPGPVTADYLVKLFNVSERALYRHIVSCPMLDEIFAPLFLDREIGMSQAQFMEYRIHLETHLGTRIPSYAPARAD